MLSRKSILGGLWVVVGVCGALRAGDPPPAQEGYEYESSRPAPREGSPSAARYELIQPCLGRGYVSYSYPAADSCPCGGDGCFHPGRYYCGGKEYRRQWGGRWLRAHLGLGSMLEGYRCECIYPAAGRSYLRTITKEAGSEEDLPPQPEPAPDRPY